MKCHCCDAEVADSEDKTLAEARWGWVYDTDPGWVDRLGNPLPSAFYACSDCSDPTMRDAWGFIRSQSHARANKPAQRARR